MVGLENVRWGLRMEGWGLRTRVGENIGWGSKMGWWDFRAQGGLENAWRMGGGA